MRCFSLHLALALLAFVTAVKAEDAPWGCQVLLCAPQENPSWQSIPYCVPPMKRLIAAMELPGFSWPICPGSGVDKPGNDKYESCEAGWTTMASTCRKDIPASVARTMRKQGGLSREDGSIQLSTGEILTEKRSENDRFGRSIYTLEKPRAKRAAPWYFDFSNTDGTRTRKWFKLED